MLAFAYGFKAPVRVSDAVSLKAAVRAARKKELTLCKRAPLERDEGAGREYYALSYPQLSISKVFRGYKVEWSTGFECKAPKGGIVTKELMLECAEQFMKLLGAPESESEEKLPSCVEWE